MSATPHDAHIALEISSITINTIKHLRRLQSATLIVNDHPKDVRWSYSGDLRAEATFEPALTVSPSDQLRIRLHRSFGSGSRRWLEKDDDILIKASQFLNANSLEEGQGSEWRQSFEGTEVIVRHLLGTASQSNRATTTGQRRLAPDSAQHGQEDQLVPTTDEIIRICPRFRILVIGNSGVGKSSLINRAFGTEDAKVSDILPGEADINKEIPSKVNPRFVLHDSRGFEGGDISNLQIVRNFIKTRSELTDLKDQLHAIWLCLETPTENSRIFETGIERLLEEKQNGDLGKVPLIVVFTKYDTLVDREDMDFDESQREELGEGAVSGLIRRQANVAFMEECIEPLKKRLGSQIPPYKEVSVEEGFEDTVVDLVGLTFDSVKKHVATAASIVSAIAQRINPEVKIAGSIAVGRRKYWSGLASGANFPGRTILECLEVIHTDIIAVWDLNDPYNTLQSKEFKALMSNMVSDIEVGNPNAGLIKTLPIVSAITGIVGVIAGPAAPIVVPVAAVFVLAKWVFDAYQNSRKTLEQLMAYIVDLTLMMEHIFCLIQGKSSIISHRLINIAYTAYNKSNLQSRAHFMIGEHVKRLKLIDRGSQDTTIDKIVEIIDLSPITSAEVRELKASLASFNLSGPDEQWDAPETSP